MSTPTLPPHSILPPPPASGSNWLSRNWKWLVLGIAVCIVCVAAFIGTIFAFVFGSMKHSDPYRAALQKATASAEVTQQLGSPINPGFFVSGSINLTGASGTADLAIPVTGPRGKGTVYVVGKKTAGFWTYSLMEVSFEGSDTRVNLLTPAPSNQNQAPIDPNKDRYKTESL